MRRELWEIVPISSLKMGDVIQFHAHGHPIGPIIPVQYEPDGLCAIVGGERVTSYDTVFRRVDPADDPRVLRRAAEKLAWEAAGTHHSADPQRFLSEAIDQARRELESEDQK